LARLRGALLAPDLLLADLGVAMSPLFCSGKRFLHDRRARSSGSSNRPDVVFPSSRRALRAQSNCVDRSRQGS